MAEMVKSFRNLFNIISKNIVVILVATVLCMVISYSIRTLVMNVTDRRLLIACVSAAMKMRNMVKLI